MSNSVVTEVRKSGEQATVELQVNRRHHSLPVRKNFLFLLLSSYKILPIALFQQKKLCFATTTHALSMLKLLIFCLLFETKDFQFISKYSFHSP